MSALAATGGGGGGGKPSPEEIAKRRAAKAAQKAAAPPKAAAAPKPPPAKKERDPAAEAAALAAFAVRGTDGAVVGLCDVGANLQSRNSAAEIDRQLARAALAGVDRVVLTGCDVEGSALGRATAARVAAAARGGGGGGGGGAKRPRVYCTAGVHPHDAKTWTAETRSALAALAASPHCVAIGECGLDYDRMFSPRETQLEVFAAQCALAVDLGRAVFVHVREVDAPGAPLGAYADAVKVLAASGVDPRRVCVHCFTGGAEDLAGIRAYGALVGFTGFIGIAKRCGPTRAAIAKSVERGELAAGDVLLETDAPFMSPDKAWLPAATARQLGVRGGKNECAVLPAVARALADAMGCDAADLATATAATASAFFDLDAADAAVAAAAADAEP